MPNIGMLILASLTFWCLSGLVGRLILLHVLLDKVPQTVTLIDKVYAKRQEEIPEELARNTQEGVLHSLTALNVLANEEYAITIPLSLGTILFAVSIASYVVMQAIVIRTKSHI